MDLVALLAALESAMRTYYNSLKTSLDSLRNNVQVHIDNIDNPHLVDKKQIGLGYVQNFPIATQAEAEAGLNNHAYMTPLRVAQSIGALAGSSATVTAHIANTSNPHAVTKAQVGLGSVDNYSTASQAEAEAGTVSNRFMTPQRTAQAIAALAGSGSIGSHIADMNNPHSTTKTQVGLGNVDNYLTATQAEAQAGTSNTVFMTALRTAQAITALGLSPTRTLTIVDGTGITGGAAFDLSANRSWTISLTGQSLAVHNLATNGLITRTAAGTVTARSIGVSGTGLSVTNADGVAGNPTVTSNATSANTASTIVARDGSGNFSAGTVTVNSSIVTTTANTAVGPLSSQITLPNTAGNRGGYSLLTATGGSLAGLAAEIMTIGGPNVAVGKLDLWVQNAASTVVGLSIAATGAVSIPGTLNVTGNITGSLVGNVSGTATTLATSRTLWGQSFNGSANVSGAMSAVTTLAMSGQLTNSLATGTAPFVVTSTTRVANLNVATAGTADVLTTARTINGTAFDGSINITTTNWGTSRTLSYTGDVTGSSPVDGSANVATALTLANSGVVAGTYNNVATEVRPFTVDAKGRITAIGAAVALAPTWASITSKPTTLAGYGITDAATSSALTTHTSNTSNPHSTTKAQVGLGSVDNFATATQAEAEAGTAIDRFMTPQRVAQAIAVLGGGGGGGPTLATQPEAEAGTDNLAYMSPLRSYQQLDVMVLVPLAAIFDQAALDLA